MAFVVDVEIERAPGRLRRKGGPECLGLRQFSEVSSLGRVGNGGCGGLRFCGHASAGAESVRFRRGLSEKLI